MYTCLLLGLIIAIQPQTPIGNSSEHNYNPPPTLPSSHAQLPSN